MTYLVSDLLEEIILKLPLKSIFKFKTVSKQWRSILESRRFAERRRMNNLQNNPQIMAAAVDKGTIPHPLKDEKEVELFYLHCADAATRLSLTCDGLVCMPVPGYVNVLNPSTREFLRFPSGTNPVITDSNRYYHQLIYDSWYGTFPGGWAMGFGKDIVNGSYKVVRMFFETKQYEILDINIGEWRKLSNPPPSNVETRKHSVCVNGSIYWLQYLPHRKILALDLHTEEFRDVLLPPSFPCRGQIVNLDDRLTIASVISCPNHWELWIWSMDAHEETWSKTYTIRLFSRSTSDTLANDILHLSFWCRPVAVSKQGNLFFYDSENKLLKYYPETDQVRIIERNICVISPFVENLFPLRSSGSIPKIRTYGFQNLDDVWSFRISKFWKRVDLRNPKVLFTTSVVALVVYGFSPYSASDLIGAAARTSCCSSVSDFISTSYSRVVDVGDRISWRLKLCALICIL